MRRPLAILVTTFSTAGAAMFFAACGDDSKKPLPPAATGAVRGVVHRLPDGAGLEGALVRAPVAGVRDTCDATGAYRLSGVPVGSAEIEASSAGFVAQSRTVQVTADAEVRRDFTLSREPDTDAGQITFTADGRLWRVEPERAAPLEDLSPKLDAISRAPGQHFGPITVSTDGAWLVFWSERFDAESAGGGSLCLAPADLSRAEAVRSVAGLVRADGLAQALAGGNAIVYSGGGGPHARDLWLIERSHPNWSPPRLLTGDSVDEYNEHPVLSPDDSRVLFEAGPLPSGGDHRKICEVGLAGGAVTTWVQRGDGSPLPPARVRTGAFTSDGGILFEAEWGGPARLWRRATPDSAPVRVAGDLQDDLSPLVLPDGRIVSLFRHAAGAEGRRHLKVMSADGASSFVLTIDAGFEEVDDIGLGAGPPIPR